MDAYSDLIGALIGLVRSLDGSATISDTAMALIRDGLSCTDKKEAERLIGAIHEEKDRLLPMCASCAAPCGRHDDYDASGLDGIRRELLGNIRSLASISGDKGFFVVRSLFAIGEDDTDGLSRLIDEGKGYLGEA